MPSNHFRFVILVLTCMLCGITRPAIGKPQASTPSNAYILEDEDQDNSAIVQATETVKALSPARRKAMITKSLASSFVFPLDFPEYWSQVTDPERALAAVGLFAEPYRPPLLDMLERLLPAASGKQRIKIAQILYRHHRAAGEAFLDKLLNEDMDIQAAMTFAANKDDTRLPQILKVLSVSLDSRYSGHFIKEFIDWQDARVSITLYTLFQQRPDFSFFALALASQNYHEAAPLIRKLYFASPPDSTAKVDAGVALVKLDGPQADQIFHFLTVDLGKTYGGTDTSVLKLVAFDDFGLLKVETSVPALQVAIKNYLSTQAAHKQLPTSQMVEPIEFAAAAAQSLAQIGDVSSANLVAQLLRQAVRSHEQSNRVFSIADSLFLLNASHKDLEHVMGKKWVQRKLLKSQLRFLP